MKNFAFNNPLFFSFIIFLIVAVGGSLAGLVGGFLLAGECQPRGPGDPCDAGAMLAVAIWTLSLAASLISGVVAGVASFLILKFKSKSR